MIPRSIKGRLTYGVAITALLIMLASGWLIYTGAKRTTYKQIDANLLDHVELHGLSQCVATDPSPAPSTYGPCQTGSATPMLPVVPIAAG